MISKPYFFAHFKRVMRLKLVSVESYSELIDVYTVACINADKSERAFMHRCLSLVLHKHKRTTLFPCVNSRYPLCAVLAFASHDAIRSRVAGCQVHKSGWGRSDAHSSGRFSSSVVSDLFGYTSGSHPLTASRGLMSCSPSRLLISGL